MFVQVKNILDKAVTRYNIRRQVEAAGAVCDMERIISDAVGFRIKVVWIKNRTVLLRAGSALGASEIRLREGIIKGRLQNENIPVSAIKCVI